MKLEELKRLSEEATKGPWEVFHRIPGNQCSTTWEIVGITPAEIWECDAKLIAAMRNNIDKLIELAIATRDYFALRGSRSYRVAFDRKEKLVAMLDELERES